MTTLRKPALVAAEQIPTAMSGAAMASSISRSTPGLLTKHDVSTIAHTMIKIKINLPGGCG